MSTKPALLLFGASGSIGNAIYQKFISKGWHVIRIIRKADNKSLMSNSEDIVWDPICKKIPLQLKKVARIDAICWAQGINLSDSIEEFCLEEHYKLYQANVIYILVSLNQIINSGLLKVPTRLCIISSIWQNISRLKKLSYAVSKSALQGLVLSLANDLADRGHLVNAILPGAIDTPMTKSNLSNEQIETIKKATGFNRLVTLNDVSNITFYLCSPENSGITGQFIKVDLGYSDVRNF
ncbi:SDR family NAD(P)-dependent oxidoreductase [Polynucleobacter sp. HIN8]|uniref:SDR family NAD(P)-dependent oxidoreductase n=1 Tax=Polynucleobacter sp. HIN8 TaxID=3047867 RepID=UPI00257479F5|nr:SDR family oxidoreductase [Polynucleobacter sp. HIN8]BEI38371.1 SDR family NAD(P)-dependent oxidoreductase [Polynucleobacter sp. HIN8]